MEPTFKQVSQDFKLFSLVFFCLQKQASLQPRAEELPVRGLLQIAIFGVISNTFFSLSLKLPKSD